MPGTSNKRALAGLRDDAPCAIRIVPVALLVAQASRLHMQPGRLRYKTTRMSLSL